MGDQHPTADATAGRVTLLTASEWKNAAAEAGADLSQLAVWKTAPDSRKGVHPDGTIDFVISDEGQDRDGDTISLEGWNVDNFLKNPVVLFAHQHDELPVGKSVQLHRDGGALVSRVEFTPRDLNPLGDTLQRMYQAGFMNAQSVGFQPRQWEERSAGDDGVAGWHFTAQDLLEHSCVPVPSLPSALIRAHEAKIDTAPLREWCAKMLDGDLPRGLAREDLERAWDVRTSRPLVLEVRTPDAETVAKQRAAAIEPIAERETPAAEPEPEAPTPEPAADPEPTAAPLELDAVVAEVLKRIGTADHADDPTTVRQRVLEAAENRLRIALRDTREAVEAAEEALGAAEPEPEPTVDDFEDAYGDLADLSDDDLRDLTLEALAEQGSGDAAPQSEPHQGDER